MAHEKHDKEHREYSHGTILPKAIEHEIKNSYIDYAMSVIVGRALPDVRDGLKPVHRRILFGMYELGNTHDKPYKKSARVVGEVLGKYHPHGDTAVYDSIVRMAQDFSLRYPLVDGQGNFGSIDGDNAAAMRYTEVRMNRKAEEMLVDIEKETVDFTPNFDNTLKEPVVMPSRLPNLLINGSSGIAVGMATNVPPHNLSEICDAIILLIDKPEVSVSDIANVVLGPDFPTGGIILGKRGIIDAYTTGRGTVRVRGKAAIEESRKEKGRKRIKITELPYQVNKSQLIENMAELVRDKRIEGISDISDRSDREGMNINIELKRDANPEVTLNQLFAHTQLETTFGIINLALFNNQPKVMALREMLDYFILHRKEVVTRRSKFELRQSEDRAHILEGLRIALANIDSVVKAVKAAQNPQKARDDLVRLFRLSEKQAAAILDMKLQRLTGLEREKIDAEHAELLRTIKWLRDVLGDEKKVLELIKKETLEMKEKYGDMRRTEIGEAEDDIEIEDLIPDEQVAVVITESDYIKRVPIAEYRSQKRGGKGVIGTETKEEDMIKDLIVASTHDYLLFFTDKGMVHWLKVYRLPSGSRYAIGKAIVNLLELKDEKVSAWIPVRAFSEKEFLVMATKNGTVKRTSLMEYGRPRRGGIIAITLREKDSLINARHTGGSNDIVLATKNGYAIRFNEKDVREIGRTGQGVRGIRLRHGDEVVSMALDTHRTLLTITENGYGKRTELGEYRKQGRGGMGIINIRTKGRNGAVVAVRSVDDSDEIMVVSSSGKMIRVPVSGISTIGRNTQGVRIMKLDDKEKIVSAARLLSSEHLVETEAIGEAPKAEEKKHEPKQEQKGQKNEPAAQKQQPKPRQDDIIIL